MSKKIEKHFYSKKNFGILKDVLQDVCSNYEPEQLNKIIIETMESVFTSAKIPGNISVNRSSRKKYIEKLNKNVLSIIGKSIKNEQQFVDKNSMMSRSFIQPELFRTHQEQRNFPPQLRPENTTFKRDARTMFTDIQNLRNIEQNNSPKHIDFKLPQTTENINYENRFNQLMAERKQYDNSTTKEQKNNVNNDIINNNTNNIDVSNMYNNDNLFNNNTSNNNLHENDFFNIKKEKDDDNIIRSTLNDYPREIKEQSLYLYISSKNRDFNRYKYSTSFSVNNNINGYKKENINLTFIENIVSIECLDVILPIDDSIRNEPFLWLCIKDWGLTNVGNNIPENAFARLKYVSQTPKFITMRPHILERQIPPHIGNVVHFNITDSCGNSLHLSDKIFITNIGNNFLDIKNSNGIEINKGDIVYIYSNYSLESVPININITEIKKEGKTVSLLYTSKYNYDIHKNDILCFTQGKTKDYYKVVYFDSKIIKISCDNFKKYSEVELFSYSEDGISSNIEDHINFKNGMEILNKENKRLTFTKKYNKVNKKIQSFSTLFLILKKRQSHLMFRITYY